MSKKLNSVTRLGDLLDFGQRFKAFGQFLKPSATINLPKYRHLAVFSGHTGHNFCLKNTCPNFTLHTKWVSNYLLFLGKITSKNGDFGEQKNFFKGTRDISLLECYLMGATTSDSMTIHRVPHAPNVKKNWAILGLFFIFIFVFSIQSTECTYKICQ